MSRLNKLPATVAHSERVIMSQWVDHLFSLYPYISEEDAVSEYFLRVSPEVSGEALGQVENVSIMSTYGFVGNLY